jgi:tetratricopeptide (TPR) repeat protein
VHRPSPLSPYDDATFQYGKAVELDDSAENRYSYGEALLKIEDYEAAEEQFNKVKTTYPDSKAGYYGMGKMYALTEAYEKAIEEFETALEIDPEFYDAMAERGRRRVQRIIGHGMRSF